MVSFFVPGEPRGKQRARVLRNPKNPKKPAYTPKDTIEAERAIGWECKRAMAGAKPLEGPVRLDWVAWFSKPSSWPKKKWLEARWHTSKPDRDNIEKLIADGLKGIAWLDDAQVCCGEPIKQYARDGQMPGIAITIRSVE